MAGWPASRGRAGRPGTANVATCMTMYTPNGLIIAWGTSQPMCLRIRVGPPSTRIGAPSTGELTSTIWPEDAVYPGLYRATQPISYIEPLEQRLVHRHAIPCSFAVLAMLAATEPSNPATERPKGSTEVVVKAVRFSEGPPSYSFMVMNHGTRPINMVSLGMGEDTFIEAEFEAVPTSTGSPSGWNGRHIFVQDPRRPRAHSPSLIKYLWTAELPNAYIQPGQSLSGFSLQFPAPRNEQRPAHPDLTDVPFEVSAYGGRSHFIGTVELD